MKAVFVAYNQAYGDDVLAEIEKQGLRGFTRWEGVQGRGAFEGEPHYGNHAWPTENHAILVFVPDEKEASLMSALDALDKVSPTLGLRAFSWSASSYGNMF